jgi:epoxyqueuosine reductase
VSTAEVRVLARRCGFELAGVTPAVPSGDLARYHGWVAAGFAGEMRYLTDRRAAVRDDPRHLLAPAQSVVCVAKLYRTPRPAGGGISRYAWGADYHGVMRGGLERLDALIAARVGAGYESKISVDTAPLLERSYARAAGLGWIGRNACLIHQGTGSWYFLGELLVSIPIEGDAQCAPPPDRCGTCRRCIDACPTGAIAPEGGVDARLCISYLTIELRGAIPEERRGPLGGHVFGCDICQDVCPWNRRAPQTAGPAFAPRHFALPLDRLAALSESDFRRLFRGTPVERARYSGLLRNVAVAMGNSRMERFRAPLEKLAQSSDPLVAGHARWALANVGRTPSSAAGPLAGPSPGAST